MAYPGEDSGPDPTRRPDWITDKPVEVDVHSLESFAKLVKAEVETNVVPTAKAVQGRLAGEGSTQPVDAADGSPPSYVLGNNRTFGVDPRMFWASLAGYRHMEAEGTIAELLAKLTNGMQAIAGAAESIAKDYSSVDARNAIDVQQVATYFPADTPMSPSTPAPPDTRATNKAL